MTKENKIVLALIFVAYIFVFYQHLYWLSWASHYKEFIWNNQVMINNVDGYFFGSGAQKILYGMHQYNPRLLGVEHYGLAVITAFIAKFFHISLDSVMLYLPAVISSFVVIPIILIGRLYNNLTWGFLAALIGGIGWSYYNRTLVGYYDTDMFSASLPMFILYFMLAGVKKKSLINALLASIFIILYPFLYDQGLSIVYAMGIMAFLYLIVFHFKEEFTYKYILILSIGLMDIDWRVRIVLLIGAFYFLKERQIEFKKLQITSILSFLVFLITGNVFGIILHKVFDYATKEVAVSGLKFLNVNETVREAGHIPWNIVFDRIIGSSVGFIIAVIGYILLIKRYKEFIIALPLWGIGLFAFIGGLRFTVYAVPIAAMSSVYFFIYFSEKLSDLKKQLAFIIGGTLIIIAPNISHIVGCCERSEFLKSITKIYPLASSPYLTPTTFNKDEVAVLDKLNQISSSKDYVITWWDYGYPIWYYGDVNTLVDGGKHNEDNFLVSKILTTPNQILAYNLAKLSIKTYVDTNKTVASQLFIKSGKPIDVKNYLKSLSTRKKDISLNRNIYFLFPYRMLNIFPTVRIFSNRDLNSGQVYPNGFFYKARVRKRGNYLYVGSIALDLKSAILLIGNRKIPVKEFDLSYVAKNGKNIIKHQQLREDGLYVIMLPTFQEALILDDTYYHSIFIQMFVLENYDKNLFEPVILNPVMKIYRLK